MRFALFPALMVAVMMAMSACSNADEDRKSMGQLLLGSTLGKLRPAELSAQAAPLVITRAQFADVPGSVVLVTLETSGDQGAVVQAAQNGDVITYHSADGIALSLRRGFLMGTRGFGFDLMEAEVSGTLTAVLQSGPRRYGKRLSYLDGEDRLLFMDLTCTLTAKGPVSVAILERTYSTQRYDEICTNSNFETTNIYWIHQGRLIKSRQWVGDNVSPLILEWLQ